MAEWLARACHGSPTSDGGAGGADPARRLSDAGAGQCELDAKHADTGFGNLRKGNIRQTSGVSFWGLITP